MFSFLCRSKPHEKLVLFWGNLDFLQKRFKYKDYSALQSPVSTKKHFSVTKLLVNSQYFLILFRSEFEAKGRFFCPPNRKRCSLKGNFSSLFQGTFLPIRRWSDDVIRAGVQFRRAEHPASLDRFYSTPIMFPLKERFMLMMLPEATQIGCFSSKSDQSRKQLTWEASETFQRVCFLKKLLHKFALCCWF